MTSASQVDVQGQGQAPWARGPRHDAPAADAAPGSAAGRGTLAVHISALSKAFGNKRVLDRVDLDIHRGEFVALLGASGTGKTTLLRILGGLEKPDAGLVLAAKVRTIVYQEPRLVPSMRVLANVIIGQKSGPATLLAAEKSLAEVGLAHHVRAWPGTLSGGEAQRVALARALVREPELLLLDEPFAALDALTRLQMQDLVATLCQAHQPAVLLVTHDVEEALRLADRILILKQGRFVVDVALEKDLARDRDDPRFLERRRHLLAELGVSV